MKDQRILVVEDDQKIRNLLRNVLEDEGARVIEAETSAEVMRAVADKRLSLITLDLQLGADNGVDIARRIRAVSQVPIIMVTGKDDVIDRVVGLEIGADDYIIKPFHVRELIARIRSVLRRSGAPARTTEIDAIAGSAHFSFDGMTAFPDRLELIDRENVPCDLTSGDFRLLNVFLNNPKRVLSRDQLMDLTGGVEWSPLDRTIDNQVARLRKKIERDPSSPKLIKTVRGIGYTFASDVRAIQPSAEPAKSA
ncbi:response regulator [Sulfitobacter aestuariivivens]|uniref:Response regulator n=1 Tax=Sulfitobacter aestuariivivens TaxID=2766981 RepID=A0A927D903_9RHOB|nr:response regulator [Sulfitobacter aestuariivivens]MBD3665412.1 response regulator [Sulfitobacter aestuariivivens]